MISHKGLRQIKFDIDPSGRELRLPHSFPTRRFGCCWCQGDRQNSQGSESTTSPPPCHRQHDPKPPDALPRPAGFEQLSSKRIRLSGGALLIWNEDLRPNNVTRSLLMSGEQFFRMERDETNLTRGYPVLLYRAGGLWLPMNWLLFFIQRIWLLRDGK